MSAANRRSTAFTPTPLPATSATVTRKSAAFLTCGRDIVARFTDGEKSRTEDGDAGGNAVVSAVDAGEPGTAQRRYLFDENRLSTKWDVAKKAHRDAVSDGRWPWFPAAAERLHHTLYRNGIRAVAASGRGYRCIAAKKSLTALDAWMDQQYRRIIDKDKYVPGATTHCTCMGGVSSSGSGG